MEKCSHISCGREKRVWLPINDNFVKDIKLHPWCVQCGIVKNISDDNAHELGYWMNILSKIANRFSLTQIQKRLIAKELAAHELFSDVYGITGFPQKELFKKVVKKYSNINECTTESFIY